MNTKHTPGPWELAELDDVYVGITHTKAGIGYIRCLAKNSDVADAEDYANARLIAAAPDLLEALQRIVRYVEDNERLAALWGNKATTYAIAMTAARAAIAKAEGEDT